MHTGPPAEIGTMFNRVPSSENVGSYVRESFLNMFIVRVFNIEAGSHVKVRGSYSGNVLRHHQTHAHVWAHVGFMVDECVTQNHHL